LMGKLKAALPDVELYLDRIAREAGNEVQRVARNPKPLLTLIEHTRQLSRL